ncbi:sensor histidine kinase [Vallicoccus soli]|uniref:histidine kinase n=1 Tax=Vallicoccus soli TaxID=2339232 RepID=A0A3A3ZCW2_9ACTN|nr:ATP-binding protein [Vallicoccus soli]RJK92824.1 sensor histidine kinase [Vallicoccus soli]
MVVHQQHAEPLDEHVPPPRRRRAPAAVDPLPADPGLTPPAGHASPGPGADGAALLVVRALCHELRTPVASLAGITRRLRQDLGPRAGAGASAETGELAELAEANARALQALLRQAHDLLATEHCGAPELRPLADVVREAVGCADVEHGRVAVRVSRAAGRVPVDGLRAARVVANLVENSQRHGPATGAIEVTARLRRGGGLALQVRDGGRLTPQLREHLESDEPPAGWRGLGLWIARRLTLAMGGSMGARDRGGLALWVHLPVAGAVVG